MLNSTIVKYYMGNTARAVAEQERDESEIQPLITVTKKVFSEAFAQSPTPSYSSFLVLNHAIDSDAILA